MILAELAVTTSLPSISPGLLKNYVLFVKNERDRLEKLWVRNPSN